MSLPVSITGQLLAKQVSSSSFGQDDLCFLAQMLEQACLYQVRLYYYGEFFAAT